MFVFRSFVGYCYCYIAKPHESVFDEGGNASNLLVTVGRVGVVVRALAFHQCGPGSISALGVIRGLSLLVLYSPMRGFPPGTPVFPSHRQKPTFDLI